MVALRPRCGQAWAPAGVNGIRQRDKDKMKLKEFAKAVGMSQTTVSRALNGHPEVSEATRARLIEAAHRLGYAPNAHARMLATGHASTIGCVIPIGGRNELVNPIYADFLAGVGEVCARRKFEINLTVVPQDEQAEAYRALKSKGLVGGLIVQFPRRGDPRLALLKRIGLPFVVHGRVGDHPEPYSWVDVNNLRAFERGTQFLLQLGHRQIALLNGDEAHDFALRRREGFLRALAAAGLPPPAPDRMLSGEMSASYGYAGAAALLSSDNPPTAVLTSSIMIAMGVKQALEERGLQPGRDLSIVTFDDDLSYYSNRGAVPVFTAMRSPVREAGRRTAEMLIGLIDAPEGKAVTELLEAELVVGRSTAPPRS